MSTETKALTLENVETVLDELRPIPDGRRRQRGGC